MSWNWLDSPSLLEEGLQAVALYGARATVASVVIPPLGGEWLGLTSGVLRILIGAWVASLVMGAEGAGAVGSGFWTLLLLKECLIGLLLGMAFASVFWVAEGVGTLLDTQSGFNTIQQNQPMSGEQNTPMGQLFLMAAITVFYTAGGLTVLLTLVLDSYRWWPVGSTWPDGAIIWQDLLRTMPHTYFDMVARLAGSLVCFLLFIDAAVSFLGRAADKLEVSTLAQPIKMLALLAVLAAMSPRAWEEATRWVSVETACRFIGNAQGICAGH